ncbi:MAG: acyltransferase family protein [Tannerellaceae bacterium]|jgi:fucose 4-O-acetylase-like acetyltransferase|nr:acyltransferase family protein [Tannerellaceae bacterium]
MEQQRYKWIDIAKGIGIILVVYGHVMRGLNSASLIDKDFFIYSDLIVYSFHMPLFFFISGLFFMKSIERYKLKQFLVEKCKTLLYPYTIYSLFQMGVMVLLSNYTNGEEDINSLYTCLLVPKAQFWFLFALFFINLLNALMLSINKKRCLWLSIIIGFIYYLFPVDLFMFSETFKYLIFFNMGILAKYVLEIKLTFKHKYFIVLCTFILVLEYFYIFKISENPFLPFIISMVGTIMVLYLALSRLQNNLLLFLIGKHSLEIYLLHILFLAGCRILLNNIFNIQNSLIHIALGTLCGLFFPLFISVFINKKYSTYLFRIQ